MKQFNFETMTQNECMTIIYDHYGCCSEFGDVTPATTLEQLRTIAQAQFESTLN